VTSTSRWFSPSTPVSSTNKTDDHNIAEILLKVVLNTITLTSNPVSFACWVICLRHYRTLSYISSLLSGSLIFINTSHDISFAFIFTDAQGLKDKPKILAMQGKILESLRRYTASHYPDDPRRYSSTVWCCTWSVDHMIFYYLVIVLLWHSLLIGVQYKFLWCSCFMKAKFYMEVFVNHKSVCGKVLYESFESWIP